MTEPCILFMVEGTTYALRATAVQMVDMLETVTRVPNAPLWVDGLVTVRGNVVPVVNLRRRFGFVERPFDVESRLIVVSLEGRLVGLAVDRAREFKRLALESMEAPPDAVQTRSGGCVEGILNNDGRLVLMLDPGQLLSREDIASVV